MRKNVDISDPAFRERFSRLRDRANLTQVELATKAGVSKRTVHNVEGAVRGVALEKTLRLLAEALGVTYGELVHGHAPPAPEAAPPEAPVVTPVAAPRAAEPRGRLSTILAVAAAVVVVAVIAAGFAIKERSEPSRGIDDAIPMAVTCFENRVDPGDPAHLGMIVRDLVVNGLSESRYVRVVSQPEIPHDDPGDHDRLKRAAAVDAGVPWVLFGSILQEAPLVLAARLESAKDGTVLATQSATAAEDETVFELSARLAALIKRALVLPPGAEDEQGLPIARVTTRSVKAYRHYVEGIENLNRLYREEARMALRQAVADDPTFAMAMIMLVHPEIAGAMAERDSLLAVARRSSDVLTPRERYYMDVFGAWSRGDIQGAIATCEALVEDYPQESEGYRLLARFYDARREGTKALAALETAVEVDPFDGMSLNRLAYQNVRAGRYDRAMDCIDRYVRLAPSQANPYDTRGDILAWTGRPEAAIESYKVALDRNPAFFPAMQNLGCMLTLTGRYDEAERYFRMMFGAEDAGARSRSRWFLGMMEVYRGRLDAAEALLRDALVADDIEQNRSDAYLRKVCSIAQIQSARGERHAGLATYRAAMDTLRRYEPGEIGEWPVDYVMMLSTVDIEAAAAYRDSVESLLRDKEENRNHVLRACDGWIQLREGDVAAACRSFERALADHDVFAYRYPLGQAYLAAGQVEEAIRILEYSANRYSSNRILKATCGVKLYYHLGRAYELAGRPDDARAMYARFLDTWDGADPAFDEIGDAHQRIAVLGQTP